ncbi:chromosome partitioning protein ParB [Chitinophaga cymbidii]|uniref:Chromosome partitioning protein ParB n=2 Tax=Chitinophaga cymbidii TaxID=1096750 RepID=A0A512RFR3_9BACT|nr:chromosome partitioning protein ParB [Chitinophaga cymbidii]
MLQPIMLKPFENGYRIIFGERRYRAALQLEFKEIRSIIKNADITDEEVKVIQLIENIQRQDIHPMQQALGFRFLIDERQMKTEDIAHSIGKTPHFVRQQLKLNDLTEQWQTLFLKNGIFISTALLICTLPAEAQKELYKNQVDKDEARKANPQISITHHTINKYKGDLTRVVFDLNDAELDKKAGSCMGCPFNSATASLFPEDQKYPHCNHVACLKNKTSLYLKGETEKVLNDPTTVLVYDGYGVPEMVNHMKEEGVELLKLGYGDDCRKITPPKAPDWKSFQNNMKGEKVTVIKKMFKDAEANFEKEMKTFEDNIAIGKFKKALVLYSHNDRDTGRYIYVELTSKEKTKKVTKKAIEQGNPTVEDVAARIKEIQQREIRAVELDQEKIHKKIVQQVKEDKSLQAIPTRAGKSDNLLTLFLLFESLNYEGQRQVRKALRKAGLEDIASPEKFGHALLTLTKPQITYLIRQIMIHKYSFNLPNTKGGYMFRQMAESLGVIPIADFEQEQAEIAKKRQLRRSQETAILKEMKADLAKKENKTRKKIDTPVKKMAS